MLKLGLVSGRNERQPDAGDLQVLVFVDARKSSGKPGFLGLHWRRLLGLETSGWLVQLWLVAKQRLRLESCLLRLETSLLALEQRLEPGLLRLESSLLALEKPWLLGLVLTQLGLHARLKPSGLTRHPAVALLVRVVVSLETLVWIEHGGFHKSVRVVIWLSGARVCTGNRILARVPTEY